MPKDLIILVADKDAEELLKALLPRIPKIESIRTFTYDIIRHANRDNGCWNECPGFLQNYIQPHTRAMVVFDFEGCGQDKKGKTRTELEKELEARIAQNGWQANHCAAIIIEPELENWIWQKNSPHLIKEVNWLLKEDFYTEVEKNGFKLLPNQKPERPKEAWLWALKMGNKHPSASLFKNLAENMSYKKCTDPAFRKFIDTLKVWFPLNDAENLH